MKYTMTIVGAALMLGCTTLRKNEFTYNRSWPAVHADARNSDYSNIKAGSQISLLWHKQFNGTINLGPTTDANGRVYITTSAPGCHLFALDSRNGKALWCTDKLNKFAVASAALIDRENRLFIADDSAMYAFDDKGNLLWKRRINGFPLSAQFTNSGRLLFITHIGKIYVLERETGAPLIDGQPLTPQPLLKSNFDPVACMKGTRDCPCANTLAYDTKTGSFFFTYWQPGASAASLWAMKYNEQNNKAWITKLWENKGLSGGSASSPDISADGKKVYINDNAGNLHALNSANGKQVWQYELGYNPGGSQSTSPEGYIMPSGAKDAKLMCLRDEGDSARLIWRLDTIHNRGIATQTAGYLAYPTSASSQGTFYNDLLVVDVRTGKVLDRKPLPGKTYFTVGTTIGPEGNIYVPTFNGHLFAFRSTHNE